MLRVLLDVRKTKNERLCTLLRNIDSTWHRIRHRLPLWRNGASTTPPPENFLAERPNFSLAFSREDYLENGHPRALLPSFFFSNAHLLSLFTKNIRSWIRKSWTQSLP